MSGWIVLFKYFQFLVRNLSRYALVNLQISIRIPNWRPYVFFFSQFQYFHWLSQIVVWRSFICIGSKRRESSADHMTDVLDISIFVALWWMLKLIHAYFVYILNELKDNWSLVNVICIFFLLVIVYFLCCEELAWLITELS